MIDQVKKINNLEAAENCIELDHQDWMIITENINRTK